MTKRSLFSILCVTLVLTAGCIFQYSRSNASHKKIPPPIQAKASSTTTKELAGSGTNILPPISIPPQLVIGQIGREVFFVTSTRYTSYNRYNELNEVRAVDLKTNRMRTLEVLPNEHSYTKQVSGPLLAPEMKASVKDNMIHIEVYFMGSVFFPNQERLPIEIHTIPVSSLNTL